MSGLVQYIIVSGELVKTLNWPLGAVIAQCCHAATAVSHLYRENEATKAYLGDLDNMHKVVLEVRIIPLFSIPHHPSPTNAEVTTLKFIGKDRR